MSIPAMGRDELITVLAAMRPTLQAEGVVHLAMFGSRARGNPHRDSDIDILVDIAPDRKFSILDLVGVEHMVTDATGVTANAFLRRSLGEDFLRSIMPHAILVF